MARILVVTNDFPPRRGGIETFVKALADRFDPATVVVYTASMPGDRAFDAALPYPVIRDRARLLLPTAAVRDAAVGAMRRFRCDRVMFGAAAPLGLLARDLRAAGARRILALTHGHEAWWAQVPGTRQALRRIGEDVDVLSYISQWCRERIARALTPLGRSHQRPLHPGVDTARFRPGTDDGRAREALGLPPRAPLVLCTGRLVKRKGQDRLLDAWPAVLARVPQARLVIAGTGPQRGALHRAVRARHLRASVRLPGLVPASLLPALFDAADVFAMPARVRRFGLEAEGLGIVYLEASASATPIVVGDAGGAPDAVRDGQTGFLVDPRDPRDIAARITQLLLEPRLAHAFGAAGRRWALESWRWDQVADRAGAYLEPAPADA